MPLRDDLLNPVPGENPSGENLRYDRVYDQIKEARTEDDDTLPAGAWERTRKKADFAVVVNLAGESLATRSKDLQLAAWLMEGLFRREGFGVLVPCLRLILQLQQTFWDTLYPEIEDGDVSLRAVPIEWMANRIGALLHEAPLTRNGLNYYQYRESRAIGYETDAASSDSKREARERAIQDKKLTAEDFDNSFAATPKNFYVDLVTTLDEAELAAHDLDEFNEAKYGNDGPSLSKLKSAVEEVKQVASQLLNAKRKIEPDIVEPPPQEEVPAEEAVIEAEIQMEAETVTPPAAEKIKKLPRAVSSEPQDEDDAAARILTCARFYRTRNNQSSIPYLLCTAVRWGELRTAGSSPSWDFLTAPSTDVRQKLKRLASEASWEELIDGSLEALASPCGRVWLDAHRYMWRASQESGYWAISAAVVSSLRSLLHDFPEMPAWTLNDDTPVANPETQRWLEEKVLPKPVLPPAPEPVEEPVSITRSEPVAVAANHVAERVPDAFDLAMDLLKKGNARLAIETLMRDAAQQPSGRQRFMRRIEVAQVCLAANQHAVAYPVLKDLAEEIERRGLENWENGEVLAKPLALLLECLEHRKNADIDRDEIFSRLCRIDPTAAITNSR